MGRCLRLRISGLSGGSATTLRGVRADHSPSARPIFHQREGSSLVPTGRDFNSGNYGASSPSLTSLFHGYSVISDSFLTALCSAALRYGTHAVPGLGSIDPPPVSACWVLASFVPPQGVVGMDGIGMGWDGCRCTVKRCVWYHF